MSDDRFDERTAPTPRPVKEIVETVFDRIERRKFEDRSNVTELKWCAVCSNTGIEQVKDQDGYNVARRCTRCAS